MSIRFLHQSFLAILAMVLVSCTPKPQESIQKGNRSIELSDCQLASRSTSQIYEAQCGKLTVFENREGKSGKRIDLNIAVIPAISRNPAPDPLFFLAGGPGEAATESYLLIASAFRKINQKRDIVLVDQRGTGASQPLDCRLGNEEILESDPSIDTKTYIQECLEQLDADPRYYTTAIAMDDLDQVREELGYPQINLYGASYGTRAALAYLRQYPDKVRSVILDGAAPPNWTLGPSITKYAQYALESLFARCLNSTPCKNSFPEIRNEFYKLEQQLSQSPITVALDHPVSGEETEFILTHEVFVSAVHYLSYAPETSSLLPLLIHQAATYQNFAPLTAQSLISSSTLEESISLGMRYSVICSEDVPYFGSESPETGYLGNTYEKAFEEICKYWPQGDIPNNFKEPVSSSVPTIILSGENDPVTPPENGDLAAQTLSNNLHIVVPGMGHINVFRGCIPSLIYDFITQPAISELDITCVAQIQPLPFFLNFNSPHP